MAPILSPVCRICSEDFFANVQAVKICSKHQIGVVRLLQKVDTGLKWDLRKLFTKFGFKAGQRWFLESTLKINLNIMGQILENHI